MSPELQAHMHNILDTFSGGNDKFMAFRMFMESIEKQKDPASRKLLDIVVHFSRLIDAAQREGKK